MDNQENGPSTLREIFDLIMDLPIKPRLSLYSSIVTLECLLVYNYVHTSSLLSRYIVPSGIGWLTGFGIETGLAALAFGTASERNSRRKRMMWAMLILALIVSSFANLTEGFRAITGHELTLETWGNLDPVMAFMNIISNVLISFIVLVMAEVIGSVGEDDGETIAAQPSILHRLVSLAFPQTETKRETITTSVSVPERKLLKGDDTTPANNGNNGNRNGTTKTTKPRETAAPPRPENSDDLPEYQGGVRDKSAKLDYMMSIIDLQHEAWKRAEFVNYFAEAIGMSVQGVRKNMNELKKQKKIALDGDQVLLIE